MSPSLLSLDSLVNPLTPKSDLTDFTLSNARRFYSVQCQTILLCPTPDDFTLSNARWFYSVRHQTILLCPTPDNFTLSNSRQFYSVQPQTILLCSTPDDFTPSNARRFYSSKGKGRLFRPNLTPLRELQEWCLRSGCYLSTLPFLFLWRMHRIIRWRPTPQIAIGSRSQLVHRQSIRQGGKFLQSAANMSSLLHDTWPCLLVLNFFWQDFLHSIRGVLLGFFLSLTWIWKKVIYQ